MQANLRRAYGQWNEELLESCAKQSEFRSIAFALAYFHAALQERKKFGVGNLPGATSGTRCPALLDHAPPQLPFLALSYLNSIHISCYLQMHVYRYVRAWQSQSASPMLTGIGWNMNYPFNTGDLLCCGQCAINYLDTSAKVEFQAACHYRCITS